jgi:hypothetical protein
MLSVFTNEHAHTELHLDLDELVREGARRMLAAALEAEVEAYIAAHADQTDEHGHRLVRRNGHAPARQLATAAGQVEVVRPRVDDRRLDPATGQRVQFASVILPRWYRRSPKAAEVLPLLYLHGLSSLDFVPALEHFFGAAAGLSASVVTRLTQQWQAERQAFLARDLHDRDYVYCWADGIHFNIRLEQGRLCCLVLVGVRVDGTKELVAVADGQRESGRRLGRAAAGPAPPRHARTGGDGGRRRAGAVAGVAGGVPRHPRAALLGPQGRQRPGGVAQERAGRCPQGAERDRPGRGPRPCRTGDRGAGQRLRRQVAQGGRQGRRRQGSAAVLLRLSGRALAALADDESDRVDLLPSPGSDSGHQGPGSKEAGLAMVFKLLEAAEGHWRAVNGPHLVALVRAGARFEAGKLVERAEPGQHHQEAAA